MALAATIKEGATTVAASGGTDVTTSSLGNQGGVTTFIFSTDTSNTVRRTMKASVSQSSLNVNSPGGRTLQRNTLRFEFPKVLADGTTSVDFFEVKSGTHPETTSAELEVRQETVAQFMTPAISSSFFFSGNLT
jgi:hypothetical protein